MINLIHCVTFLLLLMTFAVSGWRNLTVDHPRYHAGHTHYGPTKVDLESDEKLPRNYIHSIYKFGWCTPDAIKTVYLRKTTNLTLSDWQSTQANYIYLLEDGDTISHRLACIVMTVYVPRKYLFRNSRLPIYYCQGDLHLVWMMTFQRLDIHEFYLHHKLNFPANFHFKFYHPPPI